MAIITSGKTFANGEQLSADKLNQVITEATFNVSGAVDGSTMTLIGGAMAVADSGIATGKIADSAVTKAKIENVANMKALGNTSGSAAAPQEVAILDEDNMSSDSATSLATQQSIKAYVDSNSITQTTGTAPYYGVRAWAYYNGTSNSLVENGNIASVTKHGTGDYEFFFDVAMPDVNYAISLASSNETNVAHGVGFVAGHATGSCRIQFYNPNNSANTTDKAYVAISIIR